MTAAHRLRSPHLHASSWRRLALLCSMAALLLVAPCYSRQGMDQKTRIEIIRGLLREVGVTKVPLPRGKHGVRIDPQGKLDNDEAQKELHNNGLAMQAGSLMQITQIQFKSDEIVFDLNGGGKSGKKWYQRIEIGMGEQTTPISPDQQNSSTWGSSITLHYDQALPNLTVAQLKAILSGVLDFERHAPTVLYSPNVTPEVKEAIKNHKVIVGMDRDAVLSAKGSPDRRVREERNGGLQENWIYGLPPHVLYITFDGDQVVAVKQY